MRSTGRMLSKAIVVTLIVFLAGLQAFAQGNPLEPPGGGGDNGGNPLQPPGEGGDPLQPPAQEKPKEVLKRASKEECAAIEAKYNNKEKERETVRKLKLEAIQEALPIDEIPMVKLIARAADPDREKDKEVQKAGDEALVKKIKHLEGLALNEAEEDRIAAVELALLIEDPRVLKLCARARKDMSATVKEKARKGALAFLQNLYKSKDYRVRLDALIEASEMIDEPGMDKLLQGALKDPHPKVRELAMRFIASLKRPGFLPAIQGALNAVIKDPKQIDLQISYIRCIGDYGDLGGVKIVGNLIQNITKFDKADPIQVKRNVGALDGLGRLRFIESAEKIMNVWTNLYEAFTKADSAPQTEEGKNIDGKYCNACMAAMAELCTNVPGCDSTEELSQGETLNDRYKNWKKWFDDNKKKLEEAWKKRPGK